jgi:hypothetical protein
MLRDLWFVLRYSWVWELMRQDGGVWPTLNPMTRTRPYAGTHRHARTQASYAFSATPARGAGLGSPRHVYEREDISGRVIGARVRAVLLTPGKPPHCTSADPESRARA